MKHHNVISHDWRFRHEPEGILASQRPEAFVRETLSSNLTRFKIVLILFLPVLTCFVRFQPIYASSKLEIPAGIVKLYHVASLFGAFKEPFESKVHFYYFKADSWSSLILKAEFLVLYFMSGCIGGGQGSCWPSPSSGVFMVTCVRVSLISQSKKRLSSPELIGLRAKPEDTSSKEVLLPSAVRQGQSLIYWWNKLLYCWSYCLSMYRSSETSSVDRSNIFSLTLKMTLEKNPTT